MTTSPVEGRPSLPVSDSVDGTSSLSGGDVCCSPSSFSLVSSSAWCILRVQRVVHGSSSVLDITSIPRNLFGPTNQSHFLGARVVDISSPCRRMGGWHRESTLGTTFRPAPRHRSPGYDGRTGGTIGPGGIMGPWGCWRQYGFEANLHKVSRLLYVYVTYPTYRYRIVCAVESACSLLSVVPVG